MILHSHAASSHRSLLRCCVCQGASIFARGVLRSLEQQQQQQQWELGVGNPELRGEKIQTQGQQGQGLCDGAAGRRVWVADSFKGFPVAVEVEDLREEDVSWAGTRVCVLLWTRYVCACALLQVIIRCARATLPCVVGVVVCMYI